MHALVSLVKAHIDRLLLNIFQIILCFASLTEAHSGIQNITDPIQNCNFVFLFDFLRVYNQRHADLTRVLNK